MENIINEIIDIDNQAKKIISEVEYKQQNIETYIEKEIEAKKEKVKTEVEKVLNEKRKEYEYELKKESQKINSRMSVAIDVLEENYIREKDLILQASFYKIIEV